MPQRNPVNRNGFVPSPCERSPRAPLCDLMNQASHVIPRNHPLYRPKIPGYLMVRAPWVLLLWDLLLWRLFRRRFKAPYHR